MSLNTSEKPSKQNTTDAVVLKAYFVIIGIAIEKIQIMINGVSKLINELFNFLKRCNLNTDKYLWIAINKIEYVRIYIPNIQMISLIEHKTLLLKNTQKCTKID